MRASRPVLREAGGETPPAYDAAAFHCAPSMSGSPLKSRRSSSPTTTAPVLDPGAGGPRPASYGPMRETTGPGADRPAGGRLCLRARPQGSQPIAHLAGFKGVLQVDGYAGYRALAERAT